MSLWIDNRHSEEIWVAVVYPKSVCGYNPEGPWAKAGWWRIFPYWEAPPPYKGAPPFTAQPKLILEGDLSPRFHYYVHARAWDGSKWVAGWGGNLSGFCPMYKFDECWGWPIQDSERCWFLELHTSAKDLVLTLHA